jgi:hypothetical protein
MGETRHNIIIIVKFAQFCAFLGQIFNIILLQEKLPTLWKQVAFDPVSKNGKNALITDYRPITILNNFSIFFKV